MILGIVCMSVKVKALHCIWEKKKNLWRSRWFHCQTQPLLQFPNWALQMERFPQSFRIILCIHLLKSPIESLWNGKICAGEKSRRWLDEFSTQVDQADSFFQQFPFVVHMLTLSVAWQQSRRGSVTIKRLLGFLELLGKIWTAVYEFSVFVLIQRQLFWQ